MTEVLTADTLETENSPKSSVCTNMIYFGERGDGTDAGRVARKSTQNKKGESENRVQERREVT
jgi:hypothetical protein